MNVEQMEWPLSKEELIFLYKSCDKTFMEIANFFGKTAASVHYYIHKYKIKVTNMGSKKTDKDFKKEVYNAVGNEYVFLEKYKGSQKRIKVKHQECGKVYKINPNDFLSKDRRCSCENNNIKKTTKSFKKEIFEIVENEYSLLSQYKNSKTKVLLKHNKCGNIYKVAPQSFLRGRRCPKCANFGYSKGEREIDLFLKDNNINNQWQYRFKECKNTFPLPFDFKIKDKPIVIEYNGMQHYEPVEYFGGKEKFKQQKENDQIKKEYCQAHNIKLITIPYWEKDNIEEILEEELKEVM